MFRKVLNKRQKKIAVFLIMSKLKVIILILTECKK